MEVEAVAFELRNRLQLSLPQNYCSLSSSNSSCSSEPSSPDSGFSSDESSTPIDVRTRSGRTLRSAIRRLPSDCRKTVRFADSIGESLETREYFSNRDNCIDAVNVRPCEKFSFSMPNFAYSTESEYLARTRNSNVCVTALRTIGNTLIGQINVLNIAFDKKVVVRWTTDNWQSHQDSEAIYSHGAPGAVDIDVFTFSVIVPTSVEFGQWDCCVCYAVCGKEFWDNNGGSNYAVTWKLQQKSAEICLKPRSSWSARRSPSRSRGNFY